MHKYHHKNKTLFFYSVAFLEADAIFKILHIFSCEGAALEVLTIYCFKAIFTQHYVQLLNLQGHCI